MICVEAETERTTLSSMCDEESVRIVVALKDDESVHARSSLADIPLFHARVTVAVLEVRR